MAILTNARRELFAQNLAKGMSADASHTAAGYKPSRQNAARMKAYDDIIGRVAELQGRDANQIMDVRDLARQHTQAAIETLVSVMNDTTAPASAAAMLTATVVLPVPPLRLATAMIEAVEFEAEAKRAMMMLPACQTQAKPPERRSNEGI